jgi:His-Xaa-Ser system protein HxsD
MSTDTGQIQVSFDQSTMSLDALQRAAYALASIMTIDITAVGDRYVCTLYPRERAVDPAEMTHRMRTEAIDQTLRLRIGEQTESVRNLVFALAFSQTGLAEEEPAQP